MSYGHPAQNIKVMSTRGIAGWSRAGLALLACLTLGAGAGERAPGLVGPSLNGGRVDLGALAGRVVVVDFWASWCEPCRRSFPILEGLSRRLASRGVTVVGVSVDDDVANARRFVNELRPTFPVLHDTSHALAERWSPETMPTTFVIGRDGNVRAVITGFRDGDAQNLERHVMAALGNGR